MNPPALLLLPPLGHDARLYDPLRDALGARAHVVALDYPRDKEFDWDGPGLLERLARWVASRARTGPVFDAIGGVSIGATLCWWVMKELPRPPRAMLLMAPGGLKVPRIRQETVRAAIDELGPLEFVRRHLGLDEPEILRSSFRQQLGAITPAVERYWRHLTAGPWRGPDAEARARALCSLLGAALEVDRSRVMAENEVPIELVWGDQDRIFTARTMEKMRGVLKNHRFRVLPGVGHYPPLEAPAAVAAIALEALGLEGAVA